MFLPSYFAILSLFAIPGWLSAEEPTARVWLTTRSDARESGGIDGRLREQEPQALAAIWRELDLQRGDTIVDIGAGSGKWLQGMADRVGSDGTVYGLEIKPNLVEGIKKKFEDTPQVRPWLGKPDRTGLPADSCDVGLMVKVYHHVAKDLRIDYLNSLRETIRPGGRLVIVERHPLIPSKRKKTEPIHSMAPAKLLSDMHEAGWFPARFELLPQSAYYVAVFVQRDVFELDRRTSPDD